MTAHYPEYPDPPRYPQYASGWAVSEASTPQPPTDSADPGTRADLVAAATVVAVLATVGALLGVVWSHWSGPQQRAYVIAAGKLYPFDEVETMAGADGRYLVLVAVTGLVAGLLLWWRRRRNRGPLVALALVVGGLAGAALTWWVGYLTGGGSYEGKTGTTIAHLPLSLHMHGLLFVEPSVAVLVYGLFTAFAVRDDLGRDDPVRRRVLSASVHPGQYPQYSGGYGDAPGALQQGDFPPQ